MQQPGVCDELRDADQVVRFHQMLREAIPDLRLTLECASTDNWRAVATGTQVKPMIPHLPVGTPIRFILESSATADPDTGKITSVCERFTLAESHAIVLPDIRFQNTDTMVFRNANEVRHQSGECQPCAYFAFKQGGCSKGEDCPYCHLCTKSQARIRRRAKASQGKLLGKPCKDAPLAIESYSNIDCCTNDAWLTDDGY